MKRKSRSKKQWSNKSRVQFVPAIKRGMLTLTHWMLAFAFLPCVWAAVKSLVMMLPALKTEGFSAWWIYVIGITGYLFVDKFLAQPMTLYVFGHELTHVVSGVLSGAKIHSFKAKANGGEVRLSKTNTFISLSPYIFPLYAIGVIMLYWIAKHWWNTTELKWMFQFFLGASLSFHVAMTLRAVHRRQPDLRGKGFFLSVTLILFGNSLIIGFLLVGLFGKTPTLKQYGRNLYFDTKTAWQYIWMGGKQAYQTAQSWTR